MKRTEVDETSLRKLSKIIELEQLILGKQILNLRFRTYEQT